MKQKGFAPILIILGIVLLLGVAGGAYYFGQSSVKAPTSPSQTPVSTSQTSISPTQSPIKTVVSPTPTVVDETVNWKTYTDTTNSFTFKYLQKYSVIDPQSFYMPPYNLSQHIITISTKDSFYKLPLHYIQDSILSISKSSDISNCLVNPNDSSKLSESKVINGATFSFGALGGVGAGNQINSTIYRVIKGQNCFEIALSIETGGDSNGVDFDQATQSQNVAKQELNQILSTFKFTN